MRTINPKQLDIFIAGFTPALREAVEFHPEEYAFKPADVPAVAGRMKAALASGEYDHKGRAMRWACHLAGIKHTRKAIEEFLCRE